MSENHYSTDELNINPETEETPKRQFTGTFAPAILHDLVEEGKLPALAAWLAMVIHAYSKGKRGCFASNGYLAKRINKSPRHIPRLLQQLEEAQVLECSEKDGKRYLLINWDQDSTDKRTALFGMGRPPHVKNDIPITHDEFVGGVVTNRSSSGMTNSSSYTNTRVKLEEENKSGVLPCSTEQKESTKQIAIKYAKQLFDKSKEKDRLPIRLGVRQSEESIINESSKGIKAILRQVPEDQFVKYFKCHLDSIGETFGIEAYDGEELHAKWDRVVRACQRRETFNKCNGHANNGNGHSKRVVVHIYKPGGEYVGNSFPITEAEKFTGGKWYDDKGRNAYVLEGGKIPIRAIPCDRIPNIPED